MNVKNRIGRFGTTSVVLIIFIVFLGCASSKEYSYERIMSEQGLAHVRKQPTARSEFEPDLSRLERPVSVFDSISVNLSADFSPQFLYVHCG